MHPQTNHDNTPAIGNVASAFVAFLTSLAVTIPMLRRGLTPLPVLWPIQTYFTIGALCSITVFLLIHAVVIHREWKSGRRDLPMTPVWVMVLLLLTVVLGVWTRFHMLSADSIWYDEDRQMIGALLNEDLGNELLHSAAFQQQPPLDYALTWQGLRLFDFNEFAMRFHPALLGALSAPLFVGILLRMRAGVAACTFGAALFLMSGWLIRYAQEARPVSLGIFTSLVYLHSVLDIYQRPTLRTAIACMGTASIFFLSIGFQPCIYSFTIVLTSLLLLCEKDSRAFVILHAGAALGGLFLSAPALKLIITLSSNETEHYVRPFSLPGLVISTCLMTFAEIRHFFLQIMGPYTLPFVVTAIFAFIIALRNNTSGRQDPTRLYVVFATFVPVFAITFRAIFSSIVSPQMFERHYLTLLPVILLVFALSLDVILQWCSRCLPSLRIWITAILAVLVAVTLPTFRRCPTHQFAPVTIREDWKGVYQDLATHASPGDIALIFSLGPHDAWTLRGFAATHFYYFWWPVSEKVRLISDWHFHGKLQSDAAEELLSVSTNPMPEHIFLVVPERWSETRVPMETLSTHAEFRVGQTTYFSWVRIPTEGNPWLSLDRVFEQFDRAVPDSEGKYRLLDFRIACSIHLNRPDVAEQHLSNMEAHDKRHLIQDRINYWKGRLAELQQK